MGTLCEWLQQQHGAHTPITVGRAVNLTHAGHLGRAGQNQWAHRAPLGWAGRLPLLQFAAMASASLSLCASSAASTALSLNEYMTLGVVNSMPLKSHAPATV